MVNSGPLLRQRGGDRLRKPFPLCIFCSLAMATFQYTIPSRNWDRAVFTFLSHTFSTIWQSVAPMRLWNFWLHSQPPPRPHDFTSKAFVAYGVVQPFPAPYFPQLFQSWRLMSLLQFGITCLWSIVLLAIFNYQGVALLEVELTLRILSPFLQKASIINNPLSLLNIFKTIKDSIVSMSYFKTLISTPVPNP